MILQWGRSTTQRGARRIGEKPMANKITSKRDEKGAIYIGERGWSTQRAVYLVNPDERDWTHNNWIFWFGEISPIYVRAWGRSFEDAFEEAAEFVCERFPGETADDLAKEAYEEALAEGLSEDQAYEKASEDLTTLNNGHYLLSWAWGCSLENPSREELAEFVS
jgi:hypothetical protein